MAVEDLGAHSDHNTNEMVSVKSQSTVGGLVSDEEGCPVFTLHESLQKLNLGDLDIDSCEVSPYWKSQLVQLIKRNDDAFSKHKLECVKAKGFVHHINLTG